jgi:hypothetical protein
MKEITVKILRIQIIFLGKRLLSLRMLQGVLFFGGQVFELPIPLQK